MFARDHILLGFARPVNREFFSSQLYNDWINRQDSWVDLQEDVKRSLLFHFQIPRPVWARVAQDVFSPASEIELPPQEFFDRVNSVGLYQYLLSRGITPKAHNFHSDEFFDNSLSFFRYPGITPAPQYFDEGMFEYAQFLYAQSIGRVLPVVEQMKNWRPPESIDVVLHREGAWTINDGDLPMIWQHSMVEYPYYQDDLSAYLPGGESGANTLFHYLLRSWQVDDLLESWGLPPIYKMLAWEDWDFGDIFDEVQGASYVHQQVSGQIADGYYQRFYNAKDIFWAWSDTPEEIMGEQSWNKDLGALPEDRCAPSLPSIFVECIRPVVRDTVIANIPSFQTRIIDYTYIDNSAYLGYIGSDIFNEGFFTDPNLSQDPVVGDVISNWANEEIPATSAGGVTTNPPQYATFKVYQYFLGPFSTSDGQVQGVINRPFLYLLNEEGNSRVVGHEGNEARRKLWDRAESMAKEKLIKEWGFLPAWANQYYGGNVQDYVVIARDIPKDLPYFKLGGDSPAWHDFNTYMVYKFDILVSLEPAPVQTNSTTGAFIGFGIPINSVVDRDPVHYEVEVQEVVGNTMTRRLEYMYTDPVNWWTPPNVENTFYSEQIGYVCWDKVSGSYNGGPFVYQNAWEDKGIFVEWPEVPSSFPRLTDTQIREVSKGLFTSPTSFMEAVGWKIPTEMKATSERYLGYLQGSTYLIQYGNPAPVYPDFAEALVYDLHLKKWGKMDVPHRQLFDLLPINSNLFGVINPSTFDVKAGILGLDGAVYTFTDYPLESELRIGKVGYHRLGFTSLEEVRAHFAVPCTGTLDIEQSLDGRHPDQDLIVTYEFENTDYTWALHNGSARWYNLTWRGHYDLVNVDVVGYKISRR